MKKITGIRLRSFAFLLAAVIAGSLYVSFKPPVSRAREIATVYAAAFEEAVLHLEETAIAFKFNKTTVDTLRAALLQTRMAYKKTECLLAYFYPEYIEEHINGAPLPRIERGDSRAMVKTPEGLQVLDQLIAAEQAVDEKVQIASLAQQLKAHTSSLLAGFAHQRITDTDWFNALRMQLVRIFTLGVTGFDSPGSLNALPEAASSLTAMQQYTRSFLSELNKEQEARPVNALFQQAIEYVQQPVPFNGFDRLNFLTKYVNPLYKQLLQWQTSLQQLSPVANSGWNNASSNIFGDDFLDPYFYTEITKRDDSKALRSLGKKLFYDPVLSSNNQVSCASCHNPALAFTDGEPKSPGNVKGRTVQRNAPSLLNAVYADRYFYDLRAFSLEQQAEHVIFNHLEFNTDYNDILQKLNNSAAYKPLFRECFHQAVICRDDFLKALASYVLSLRSFNSSFDRYVRGESTAIEQPVKDGFNLFMGKAQCGTCHFAPLFSGLTPPFFAENESEVLGVPENADALIKKVDADNGRADNQLYSEMASIYERSFKTSSIRNAALTAPYFHNGVYKTLDQVIEFYNNGGGVGHGLTINNQTLSADSLHLTVQEKNALITFITSLSDKGTDY
jgi:cytochrome c peroxidase